MDIGFKYATDRSSTRSGWKATRIELLWDFPYGFTKSTRMAGEHNGGQRRVVVAINLSERRGTDPHGRGCRARLSIEIEFADGKSQEGAWGQHGHLPRYRGHSGK
jgi:hypothetical protein